MTRIPIGSDARWPLSPLSPTATYKLQPGRNIEEELESIEWLFCTQSFSRMVISDKWLPARRRSKVKFRLGELFCGPGGIGLAAKEARVQSTDGRVFEIEHAWATDYDTDTCNTYRTNFFPTKPEAVVCEDIRTLDFEKLAEIEDEVDALAFGFPCNDFSVVGEQKGINGEYGPLYTYCVKAVRRFRPKWFFAENVGGLRTANDGKAFRLILREFAEEGYDLYPHLYKFEEYGVPQTRHRIVIIGIRSDLGVRFGVPSPEPYRHLDVSARTALTVPPIPEDAPNHELTKQAPHVVERLKYIKPGENAFTADLPDHLKLRVRGAKISQIYRRLDPDKPSYTITGSGGGGTHVYHWSEPRALTNRERARLQTFPDWFVFCGGKESVRKQIGMAVPPQGAKIILEAVLHSFAGHSYPTVPPNLRHHLDTMGQEVLPGVS